METSQIIGKLNGKVAVVTGASRGIGRAIAERLSHDGAAVVVNYSQNADKAWELVARLEADGGRALAVRADLSKLADVQNLFEQVEQHFGHLDILVNNAGVAGGSPLDGLDENDYARIFDLNVRGVVFATQEAVRRFGPDGGRVINLSSVLGRMASPYSSLYAASKAAVDSITRSLAAELGSRHITVNAIAPGLTATDMGDSFPTEVKQTVIRNTALGRLGEPQDIADVVAFIASDEARWINGQTIYADGGLR
ncbi:glucose 1-dehydrogenase [Larkinella soli]|uniref:glucose 1-dehydrogenase n=1 Tax=Larkinella soli TaxID=1770527 RepID=UPI0019D047B0|nr:glucose 1-dehydrogenase [Larkinella soli]